MIKLTILGGSSPFTAELINKLAERAILKNMHPMHVFLHGRSVKALELIKNYGDKVLGKFGWKIEYSSDIKKAVAGADIILYQIRYGGLKGREDDENLARKFGFPPDETLGPSGLQSAIRMSILQKEVIQSILAYSPEALVVCLTNPLSVGVSLLRNSGIKNVIGLCELPEITAKKISEVLEINFDEMKWDYHGLNHRGFIYNVRHKDQPLFQLFLDSIKNDMFEGISKKIILSMEAIPLKHFRLFFNNKKVYPNRSTIVEGIRNRLIASLSNHPEKIELILSERYMAWYSDAVVPFLEAVQNNSGKKMVINYLANGCVIESKAHIFKDKIEVVENAKPAPKNMNIWVKKFIEHEKAILKACKSIELNQILSSLSKDPLLRPNSDIEKIASSILDYNKQYIK